MFLSKGIKAETGFYNIIMKYNNETLYYGHVLYCHATPTPPATANLYNSYLSAHYIQ